MRAAIRYDRICLLGVLAPGQKSVSFCIFDIQIEQIFDALSALLLLRVSPPLAAPNLDASRPSVGSAQRLIDHIVDHRLLQMIFANMVAQIQCHLAQTRLVA